MAGTVDDPLASSAAEFPPNGTLTEQLRYLVRYAILAPSGHNTQPWRFYVAPDGVDILRDSSRRLPVVDPDERELVISCGAAAFTLVTALRHVGYRAHVFAFPEPARSELVARVVVDGVAPPTPEEEQLFEAIPERHTNRNPFEPRQVPPEVQARLVAAAARQGAHLTLVVGEEMRRRVADLVAEADRRQLADPGFQTEAASWLRSGAATGDGIPVYAQGANERFDLVMLIYASLFEAYDAGNRVAAGDQAKILEAPMLAVLGTDGDAPGDWFRAGMALANLLLRAQVDGVSASFFDQVIEVPELAPQLAAAVGEPGAPQMLIRLGYGPAVRPTPRRPVEDVVD